MQRMKKTPKRGKKVTEKGRGKSRGVTVRECQHPRYSHVVRWPGPDGKRLASYFTNETEALAEVKKLEDQLGKNGTERGIPTSSEWDALELWRGFVESEPDAALPELADVLRDFRDRWKQSQSSVTVEAAVESYHAAKQAEGLRSLSTKTLWQRCGRFAADFAGRPVSSITTAEISDWILSLRALPPGEQRTPRPAKSLKPLGLEGKRNYRMAIHGLFNFAKARGWVKVNPVSDAARPKPRPKQPGILRPADVARLLHAMETEAPEILPFWSVRFFAGIREQEALRLDWSMVNLTEGEIHLPGTITKTYQPRTIKIEPALAAFLKPHARRDGPLCSLTDTARRYRLGKAVAKLRAEDAKAEEAGEDARHFPASIPKNAARHSFATYHLMQFRHAGETALQLGHGGSPALLHRHYKGIATAAEAKAFWSIRPSGKAANVIDFKPGTAWPDDEPLQRLLWEKPKAEIARELGVSGKAVEKHAKRRGLDMPPRGHWAKAENQRRAGR